MCEMLYDYVGIDEKPSEMVSLFHGRKERPALGMLNACSGSGKSAIIQYCEKEINDKYPDEVALTLAISFGLGLGVDSTELESSEGLAMRIAERFLMKRVDGYYFFSDFKDLWIEKNFKERMNLKMVLTGIQAILSRAMHSRRVLILVDDPGRAGSSARKKLGTDPAITKELFDEILDFQREETNVRFVFSSLKPIYNARELSGMTKNRGRVVWIDVPYFSQSSIMRETLTKRLGLQCLKSRMSRREFELASDLIITMASGHWATFDSITARLDQKFLLELPMVYYEVIRDVVVQMADKGQHHKYRTFEKYQILNIPKTYRVLIMMSIFGTSVDPEAPLSFDQGETAKLKKKDVVSLNDMSYERIVQNRTSFREEVPHLSLFDIRKWCLSGEPYDSFTEAIRDILYSVAHEPNEEYKQEKWALGIAFERTSTAFLLAKFISWRALSAIETDAFTISKTLPLGRFLKGYTFIITTGERARNNYTISMPEKIPERLYVWGKGGFRSKLTQEQPKQLRGEKDEQFQTRKSSWYEEALSELDFESHAPHQSVGNGDIICPGSMNRPHSNAIIVVDWVNQDGQKNQGLIFNQLKRSEGEGVNSSTIVESAYIVAGLKMLVRERGLLYDIDKENLDNGNQISALGIQEENVVFCWSVPCETEDADDSLQRSVEQAVDQLGFRGSVLVLDNTSDPTKSFGQTFRDIAHLHINKNMLRMG